MNAAIAKLESLSISVAVIEVEALRPPKTKGIGPVWKHWRELQPWNWRESTSREKRNGMKAVECLIRYLERL